MLKLFYFSSLLFCTTFYAFSEFLLISFGICISGHVRDIATVCSKRQNIIQSLNQRFPPVLQIFLQPRMSAFARNEGAHSAMRGENGHLGHRPDLSSRPVCSFISVPRRVPPRFRLQTECDRRCTRLSALFVPNSAEHRFFGIARECRSFHRSNFPAQPSRSLPTFYLGWDEVDCSLGGRRRLPRRDATDLREVDSRIRRRIVGRRSLCPGFGLLVGEGSEFRAIPAER